MTQIGVVGHVEWVDFAVVDRLPRPGEIVHVREHFEAPGGGGAVAAIHARRMLGRALFLTALGRDALGERAHAELRAAGVDVRVAWRREPTRRAFTYLDDEAERTITVLGDRLVPHGADDLAWDELAGLDAVYFTGGDPDALRRARAAKVLVATPRALDTLRAAGVELDVLVASASDPGERYAHGDIDPPPRHVVLTEGEQGGRWSGRAEGRWVAAQPPGPAVDAYGCGDAFAIGLTCALGAGYGLEEAATLGARCGAEVLAGRGPYGRTLAAVRL